MNKNARDVHATIPLSCLETQELQYLKFATKIQLNLEFLEREWHRECSQFLLQTAPVSQNPTQTLHVELQNEKKHS